VFEVRRSQIATAHADVIVKLALALLLPRALLIHHGAGEGPGDTADDRSRDRPWRRRATLRSS
jgi:hypothetical protein